MNIALIDYGIGNLRSVKKAFEAVGTNIVQTSESNLILNADKVVLPGVGAFKDGVKGLQNRNLIPTLRELKRRKTPLLGICLGMQLLFDASSEMGNNKGLGFIEGEVRKFSNSALKIPQTGWNQIEIINKSPLLKDVKDQSYVYFNHSYYCDPSKSVDMIAQTDYGLAYASAVQKGSIYGVQFHPEKSQDIGLIILKNFVEHCQ